MISNNCQYMWGTLKSVIKLLVDFDNLFPLKSFQSCIMIKCKWICKVFYECLVKAVCVWKMFVCLIQYVYIIDS